MWDLRGWPDTPSDNLQCLELPWQCYFSCPARFSLLDSQTASAILSLCICSSIQPPAAARLLLFLGTVCPYHKRLTQLLRGMLLCLSNSFSPQYEESQGQRLVYPKWFLSWDPFKSQVYPATCNAHSGHINTWCGVCQWGKTGQCGFTLWYFSCS